MRLTLLRRGLLGLAFALLLLVGVARTSAAKPPLGVHGWAPPALSWGPGSGLVTTILWMAYGAGALAVLIGLVRPPLRSSPWGWPLALGVLALFTGPFGSADHTNYAAYGRIAMGGGDPYSISPEDWRGGLDPITAAVQPPWQDQPTVYGPVATSLHALASWIGGANLRETVWVWQVLVVLAWLGIRGLLRMLTDDSEERARIDVLWTFNPLVFGVMVLGAHVDLVATFFLVGAVVAARRNPWVTGFFVGAALCTKITHGVVLLPILWAWRQEAAGDRSRLVSRVGRLAGATAAVVIPGYLIAGPHALLRLGGAGGAFSLASPWSPVGRLLRGFMPDWCMRTIVLLCAAAAMLLIAAGIIRIVDYFDLADRFDDDITRHVVVGTLALFTAFVLAAPYALPWYDAPVWALLPLVGAFAWDAVLVGRLLFVALAYVPGRVSGVSPAVENWTLGFRRDVAPWIGWLALAIFAFWEHGVHRARRFRLR